MKKWSYLKNYSGFLKSVLLSFWKFLVLLLQGFQVSVFNETTASGISRIIRKMKQKRFKRSDHVYLKLIIQDFSDDKK